MAEKVVSDSAISASIVRLAFPYRAKYDTKTDIIRKIKFITNQSTKKHRLTKGKIRSISLSLRIWYLIFH